MYEAPTNKIAGNENCIAAMPSMAEMVKTIHDIANKCVVRTEATLRMVSGGVPPAVQSGEPKNMREDMMQCCDLIEYLSGMLEQLASDLGV